MERFGKRLVRAARPRTLESELAAQSPILSLHERAEAMFESYGPPEAGVTVVQTYGYVELEYAAIRKGCVLLDLPTRGTITVTGADRLAFLDRMVTQELKGWEPMTSKQSFWLNRKGRIDADLRLLQLNDAVLMDVDIHAAARACETLPSYAVMDDVAITNESAAWHRLALHGPAAAKLLDSISTPTATNAGAALADIAPGQVSRVVIAGKEVVVDRLDSAGEIGLELCCRTEDAMAVYTAILDRGSHPPDGEKLTFRPGGWAAYNIARIEAGTPMYYLDFGPDSLPAETGMLKQRVSFTKGCYLGQEIVARLHSLGHPKQQLVAIDLAIGDQTFAAADGTQDATGDLPRQPITGSFIYPAATTAETMSTTEPVGAVTSATLSPMLGNKPVCFAMVKYKSSSPGTGLMVDCESTLVPGTVRETLAFVQRGH